MKYTQPQGLRYTTSGGTREYNGYQVYARRHDGKGLVSIYNSTETYRTLIDLIRQLPNYDELSKKAN